MDAEQRSAEELPDPDPASSSHRRKSPSLVNKQRTANFYSPPHIKGRVKTKSLLHHRFILLLSIQRKTAIEPSFELRNCINLHCFRSTMKIRIGKGWRGEPRAVHISLVRMWLSRQSIHAVVRGDIERYYLKLKRGRKHSKCRRKRLGKGSMFDSSKEKLKAQESVR